MKPRTRGELLKRGRSLKGWNSPDGIETFYEVRSRDSQLPPEEFARLPRRPVHIVLDNLRSAFNVGSIFRLADAIRAQEVVTCGYTCHPPHHKLEQTALGATESVPWRHFLETTDALTELRKSGVAIVGVETVAQAVRFHRFEWRFPAAIVLGNEALGLSPSVLKLCSAIVQIPVFGYKNSINVAAACAVVLYDIARQAGWLDEPETGR
ncbi:MAG: RNA methyltransferase [candidate division WOR-3 bacterium]